MQQPPTRSELTRALAINAATKPVNVSAGAGVAVGGFLLGAPWLLAVAAVVYAALSVITFFDEGEAERVGGSLRGEGPSGLPRPRVDTRVLPPRVGVRFEAAMREEAALRRAITESDVGLEALTGEVDGLSDAVQSIARRATRLHEYVAGVDIRSLERRVEHERSQPGREALVGALNDQLATVRKAEGQLDRFDAELDHVIATLSTMRGEVVQLDVGMEGAGERALTERARELREQVGAAADALAELEASRPDF